MSSEGSVTQAANNQNQQNQNQATQIAKEVKKEIGLTAVGGLGGNNQGYIAANAPNPLMYGGYASQVAQQQMADAGLGTVTPQGSFQNIVGNQIISSTASMMGTGMGTGEQTVMGQIPISKKMFEQQKKLQMIATGAMALAGVPLMGAAFAEYNANKYSDYVDSFNNTLQSSTSMVSSGKSDSGSTNATSTSMATGTTTINDTGVDGGPSEAARLKKLALTKKTAALDAKRKLFNTTNQTITGAMV